MKQPILRIKKGALIYDDAAAREVSELPRPALPGKKAAVSRRRKKRSAGLTYFPLVIIAVGLFILFRIVPNTPVGRATVSGWQVTLHVTPYGDTLIVGVTFLSRSPLKRSQDSAAPALEAAVRLSFPGTGEQQFVAGDLVKSPMTLRGELPWIPGIKRVQAEVSVGGSRVTLWKPAPKAGAPLPTDQPTNQPAEKPTEGPAGQPTDQPAASPTD
jgi:hypothetical protein